MPVYVYRCNDCGAELECYYRMNDKPRQTLCTDCGAAAISIPVIGGIQGEEPAWLDDEVRNVLQTDDQLKKSPITCRTEYNKYLKDNDIVPIN